MLTWSYKYLTDERSESPLASSRNVIGKYISEASCQDSTRDFGDFPAVLHKSCTRERSSPFRFVHTRFELLKMSTQTMTDACCWQAVRTRDPLAHSSFVYAVTTTRIYCRPTCPARLARRANVVFYHSAAAADKDKFRPCKRCSPDKDGETLDRRHRTAIKQACDTIRQNSGVCKPDIIAREIGFSPRYFHGLFKRQTGLTPTQFAEQCVQLSDSTSRSVSTQTKSPQISAGLSSPNLSSDIQALSASTKALTSCTNPTQRAPYETSAAKLDEDLNLDIQVVPDSTHTVVMVSENTAVLPDMLIYPDFGSLDHCNSPAQSISAWFDFTQYYEPPRMDDA